LGDWNCHVLDPVFWALDLGAPRRCGPRRRSTATRRVRAETFPAICSIDYDFPARATGRRSRSLVHGTLPPRPEELEPERKLVDIGPW